MANLRIFDYNLWDYESLEMSSENPSWPIENTQERWKTQTWHSTGCNTEYIRTTGATGLQIFGVFLINGNITASGTVTIKGSDDNWSTTPTSQVMTRSADGKLYVYFFSSPITRDDWGVYISDASNPDGYISIGRIWIGTFYEEAIGYNNDSRQWTEHNTTILESTGGQVSILEKSDFKKFSFPFDVIKNKTRYDTCIDRVGKGKEFFILKKPKGYKGLDYPTPGDYSFYVYMKKHEESPLAGNFFRAFWELQEER